MGKAKVRIDYGIHAVRHTLEQRPQDVLEIWLASSKRRSAGLSVILQLAKANSISVQPVRLRSLNELTGTRYHQGVAIRHRCSRSPREEEDLLYLLQEEGKKPKLFLVLDQVQDPQNLGACLRTADAAGVDAVIVPAANSVGLTAAVNKVASGAIETVPFIRVANLARSMRRMQDHGIWLVGTSEQAVVEIYDVNLSGNIAIVMGGENKGLRENTRKYCDDLVCLPMLGSVESLNVSVATGICLYEVLRQRGKDLDLAD